MRAVGTASTGARMLLQMARGVGEVVRVGILTGAVAFQEPDGLIGFATAAKK